ncbi:P-loop containing nucleoside triphosphate hydrolase protein [Naematelia encephala]|uniref:Origin recognition complex subunit 1 n=1 Tax=Naematelia encephala TaxID=71784 RepID=A0A1Y2BLC0_9TREE|nr:P-loop containing nucleoside triphosphate hydrolase protein [Naematelia encephala]
MTVPVTPRRSTRGALFTPTTQASPSIIPSNTTFAWTSHPVPPPTGVASSSTSRHYNSFTRIVSHTGLTPRKKFKSGRPKAGNGDDESRFAIGDGVLVAVEGNGEGVGILVRLWEEEKREVSDQEDGGEESDEEGKEEGKEEEDRPEIRMMAEIHWCFRRQDLPSVMKNLSVQDNEVLLAASPIRPSTTAVPIPLLLRTVPIYSRQFFHDQFAETKSSIKGWTYIRQGIYWCNRAFDKWAKGGKVWKVDVDKWRESGKQGRGWDVPLITEAREDEEAEVSESSSEDEGIEAEVGGEEESAEEGGEVGDESRPAKRKRPTKTTRKANKRVKITAQRGRKKRVPHPKSSVTHLPTSVPSLEDLPVDPYERALRLLHVGATPESLPCREDEFVDVLSRVEEGVEGGGGGCLYIAGVPGTGKTATVHAVVKELMRKAEDGELAPFSYVEINGLKIPSPQHAYTVLWEAISGQKGTSSKTALRGLEGHFGRKTMGARGPRGHTFVVLMDELDQLLTTKQDVVYNFFNWPTMRDSQLFVIAVANRMDLPQHLAAKIKSRLGLQTVLFQPYDRTNLVEIVQSRLVAHPRSKAEHKVLALDAITLAATKMAGTNGDARRVLDACRRAVEVALETTPPHPVTPKEMMAVLNAMSSSPVALFVKQCSVQQKMMMAAVVRCVRREGIPEIPWKSVRTDHDNLTRSLLDTNDILSTSELALVLSSLLATHALTCAWDLHKILDDRKVALGMEIGEVGRVLMGEGEAWRRALAGT